MKLTVDRRANLRHLLRQERRLIGKQAAQATKEATNGLKASLRHDIVTAGLGARLSRTWRAQIYDRSGVGVTGFIYSRAPEIIEAFDQGMVIHARQGRYLAIPTENVPKRINRRKPTPQLYTKHRGPLRFVRNRQGSAFLVADDRRASFSRKTGDFQGFRKASQRTLRTGRGLTSVVMFILVPMVRMPKKLDVQKIADRWGLNHLDMLHRKYK